MSKLFPDFLPSLRPVYNSDLYRGINATVDADLQAVYDNARSSLQEGEVLVAGALHQAVRSYAKEKFLEASGYAPYELARSYTAQGCLAALEETVKVATRFRNVHVGSLWDAERAISEGLFFIKSLKSDVRKMVDKSRNTLQSQHQLVVNVVDEVVNFRHVSDVISTYSQVNGASTTEVSDGFASSINFEDVELMSVSEFIETLVAAHQDYINAQATEQTAE